MTLGEYCCGWVLEIPLLQDKYGYETEPVIWEASSSEAMFTYIKDRIDSGQPVMLFEIFEQNHAVVIVGYEESPLGSKYVYIHDPSGHITENHFQSTYPHKYAKARWNDFFDLLQWGGHFGLYCKTVVIEDGQRNPKEVTIQLAKEMTAFNFKKLTWADMSGPPPSTLRYVDSSYAELEMDKGLLWHIPVEDVYVRDISVVASDGWGFVVGWDVAGKPFWYSDLELTSPYYGNYEVLAYFADDNGGTYLEQNEPVEVTLGGRTHVNLVFDIGGLADGTYTPVVKILSQNGDTATPITEAYLPLVKICTDLSNYMAVPIQCPADISLVDPDGHSVNKQTSEILGATYVETDINGDGDPDDIILIRDRKIGDYQITVIPEPDAEPTDTYTLEVLADDTTIVLAENVLVSDILDQPYLIESTETEINAAPIAEAEINVETQPKPLIEEPDDTYIIEGNTFEGATITLDATASYDPEGNPLTYEWSGAVTGTEAMLDTYLPIGEHQVILTVSDGALTATDVLDITIQDTILPEVSAEFIPVDVEEEEGLFEISYSATDIFDPDPDTTGVILTPQLINPEVEFHVEEEIKLEYDLEENEVEVKGPDPEALWQEIQELGGLRVEDGQQVYIEPEEESEEVEIKYEDGILKIEEYLPTLRVTAEDAYGNVGDATAQPVFAPEGEEN